MRIGITDTYSSTIENYIEWIHRIDPTIEMVRLSYRLNNVDAVNEVDALILTGGDDVHPKYYGKPELISQTEGVDLQRDEFEFAVIRKALEADLPILAICRRMQVLNVALEGTLIVDLPSTGYEDHSKNGEEDRCHPLEKVPHTMLEMVTGAAEHDVNSNHHQAVDELGRGLMACAYSPDGVIEAFEWALKDRMPFLLGVQWHPERMKDVENPLSRNIAEYFLREVQISINQEKTT